MASPSPRGRGTPPATVQTMPVPAQARHLSAPRRLVPGLSGFCASMNPLVLRGVGGIDRDIDRLIPAKTVQGPTRRGPVSAPARPIPNRLADQGNSVGGAREYKRADLVHLVSFQSKQEKSHAPQGRHITRCGDDTW